MRLLLFLGSFFIFHFLNGQPVMPDNGLVFQDDVVPKIFIEIPTASLDLILDSDNIWSNTEYAATFIFSSTALTDTIENIGFRLRGNTSRNAAKKSFKVSFNTFEKGREWYGLEKINLKGEHNDPSISRSKICWDILSEAGLPGSRTNHVELYINNEYKGLYINIEHIDENFVKSRFGNNDGNLYKCIFPADLQFKGNNPSVYKEEFWGRRAYQLKTNTAADDYSDFASFISTLVFTPVSDLPCELEKKFNVDGYLQYLAFDVLTGNWDGPVWNKNNFYLYKNLKTNRFEYLAYDLDNTFGIDWFNIDWASRSVYEWERQDEPRPLYTRILANAEYRDRFSYYLYKMLENQYNPSVLFPKMDSLKLLIAPSAWNDLYKGLDYGFTNIDFQNSHDQAWGNHVPYSIKSYINQRFLTAHAQLQLNDIPPIIRHVNHNYPDENDAVFFTCELEDDYNITNAKVHYSTSSGVSDSLVLWDDGLHGDGAVGDGTFGAILPALNASETIEYYITAWDNVGQSSRQPTCNFYALYTGLPDIPLYINEVMASNFSGILDEENEAEDWIEIYNGGPESIFLGDKFLSDEADNPDKWKMPNLDLGPGEFALFWADDEKMESDHHCTFKLNASEGETIGIYDAVSNGLKPIDKFTFPPLSADQAFGRLPDGSDFLSKLYPPTPGTSNLLTSVDAIKNINYFNVSPNPYKDNFYIEIKTQNIKEYILKIINIQGKTIYSNTIKSKLFYKIEFDKNFIQKNNMQAGLYFIQLIDVKAPQNVLSQTLVKMN